MENEGYNIVNSHHQIPLSTQQVNRYKRHYPCLKLLRLLSTRAYTIISYNSFFTTGRMSCYLKITYLSRHRKYRYCRDRPINFTQIRNEFLLPHTHTPLQFILTLPKAPQEAEKETVQQLQMDEQQLSQYLKSLQLNDKETIRIKIMEPTSKIKGEELANPQEENSQEVPVEILRGNSKSEQVKVETATFPLRTDTIEVTQQFLCNSTIDRYLPVLALKSEDIRKQLQRNTMLQKELLRSRKLKDISGIYSRMKAEVSKDTCNME